MGRRGSGRIRRRLPCSSPLASLVLHLVAVQIGRAREPRPEPAVGGCHREHGGGQLARLGAQTQSGPFSEQRAEHQQRLLRRLREGIVRRRGVDVTEIGRGPVRPADDLEVPQRRTRRAVGALNQLPERHAGRPQPAGGRDLERGRRRRRSIRIDHNRRRVRAGWVESPPLRTAAATEVPSAAAPADQSSRPRPTGGRGICASCV